MKYPYYAFSSEFGTFALEAKYARDLGTGLVKSSGCQEYEKNGLGLRNM